MVDLEERPRVSLPWWTWLSFLIPVAFLALSGWMLIVAQNSRRQDAGRALAAGRLEQLERALVQLQRGSIVLWRSPVASDSVQRWRALYRDYRSQVKQIDGSDPAIREVMDYLMRVYAAVGRSEQIRLQLLSNTAPEAEARVLESEFRSKLDVALAEVRAAAARLQVDRGSADDLPAWIGFALAGAGLAVILGLVLFLLGRQSARLTNTEVDAAAVLAEAQGLQGRYQSILNAAPDAFLLAGESGAIEAANAGAQILTGYPVAELLGQPLTTLFPSLNGGVGATEPAGQAAWVEVEIRRRDGASQSLDACFRRTPAESAPGTLVLLRAAGKGRLETQLRSQRDFLNSVLETADVMLAVLDERGRITSINGALERKTGLTPAQVKGQLFQTVFALEPIAGRPMRFPAPSGLCWVRREEERRRILWHGTDLLGRGGAIKSVVVLGVDLTEFLPALAASAPTTAEAEAKERGLLAARVAQTLSDSLTAITGYAELLLEAPVSGEAMRADLKEILAAGQRAVTVTHRMLSFAQRDILRPQAVDLNQRIEAMRYRLLEAAGKGVAVRTDFDRSLGRVTIDPASFDELLLILVRNAGEAMPQGGEVTIRTTSAHSSEGAAWVAVAVLDTGTGIAPETQKRLFEPFFTTKDPRKALGLGLAAAQGIVRQAGGRMRIDSAPGAGTTVSVLLPVAAASRTTPAIAGAANRQA